MDTKRNRTPGPLGVDFQPIEIWHVPKKNRTSLEKNSHHKNPCIADLLRRWRCHLDKHIFRPSPDKGKWYVGQDLAVQETPFWLIAHLQISTHTGCCRGIFHTAATYRNVWSLWKPSNRPKKTLVTKGTSFQTSTYGVGGKKNNTCFNPLDVFLAALTLWCFKWPHISSSKLLRLNVSNFSKTISKVVFRNIQSPLVSGYHFKNNCWTPWPLGHWAHGTVSGSSRNFWTCVFFEVSFSARALLTNGLIAWRNWRGHGVMGGQS